MVLALPRGGVPVAFEIAHALQAPLDIFVVRKLGFPGHEEYAMGAIASGGVRVMNPMPGISVSPQAVADVVAREEAELVRRELLYRDGRPAVSIGGRTVIVVDDGLATGSTMLAAVEAIRQQHPARLVVAVPVGAEETCEQLRTKADEVVCAATPYPFRAVGLWYRDFPQTSDDEVQLLLWKRRGASTRCWLIEPSGGKPWLSASPKRPASKASCRHAFVLTCSHCRMARTNTMSCCN